MAKINYYINGVSLRDYGVFVSKAKGLLSIPDRKNGISHSFDNEHGISCVVSDYVKERKITLTCFTDKLANGAILSAIENLKRVLYGLGMFQLNVDIEGSAKMLDYWVYCSGPMDINIDYDGIKSMATFNIVMTEPCPMKKVFVLTTNSNDQELEVEFQSGSDKFYSIVWGDGATTEDLTIGDFPTHTYAEAGTYRMMIVGDVTNLTVSNVCDTFMNIIEEWNQLL